MQEVCQEHLLYENYFRDYISLELKQLRRQLRKWVQLSKMFLTGMYLPKNKGIVARLTFAMTCKGNTMGAANRVEPIWSQIPAEEELQDNATVHQTG